VIEVSSQDTVSIRYFRIAPIDTAMPVRALQQAARARHRAFFQHRIEGEAAESAAGDYAPL
jgi:hypothetical protein